MVAKFTPFTFRAELLPQSEPLTFRTEVLSFWRRTLLVASKQSCSRLIKTKTLLARQMVTWVYFGKLDSLLLTCGIFLEQSDTTRYDSLFQKSPNQEYAVLWVYSHEVWVARKWLVTDFIPFRLGSFVALKWMCNSFMVTSSPVMVWA